ncbi:GNAT family N-acetyltransferase [Roseibium sp.]|uniref:GNAT family N-acetyltransferase n=1 Tax=Roseibium sp. TaxID=1936156 RepID=UPI003D14F8B6
MTYQITDCRGLFPEQLCAATNAAFSDYVVPTKMSEDGFREFQRQRGFSPAHSFVAWSGKKIAAFWYSSPPNPAYGNRAYTLSVGTDPAHRRKGLSRQLLQSVIKAQTASKASGLQLEVITNNSRAVEAYRSFGFCEQRTLRVCKLPKSALEVPMPEGWSVAPLALDAVPGDTTSYFDVLPTPQNSLGALTALADQISVLGLRRNGELIGWGAVYKDGAVAQIAVHKGHRRQGGGTALLRALGASVKVDHLVFVNVDEVARGLNAFLDRFAAETLLQQYEMQLIL